MELAALNVCVPWITGTFSKNERGGAPKIVNVPLEAPFVDCESVMPCEPTNMYCPWCPSTVPVVPNVLPESETPMLIGLKLAVTIEELDIPNEIPFELEKTTVPLVAVCVPAAIFGPVWFVVPPPAPDRDRFKPLLFSVMEPLMFAPLKVVAVPA